MNRSFESLSGTKVDIVFSNDEASSWIEIWPRLSEWISQIVYSALLGNQRVVLKILKPNSLEKFLVFEDTEFDEREFLQVCINTLKTCSWILLPACSEVAWFTFEIKEKVLGFIQSDLWQDFIDDSHVVKLPDLWILDAWIPVWKVRPLNFHEGFYFPETWETFFADWDKYLLRLLKIAKSRNVRTYEDLRRFSWDITAAWEN